MAGLLLLLLCFGPYLFVTFRLLVCVLQLCSSVDFLFIQKAVESAHYLTET